MDECRATEEFVHLTGNLARFSAVGSLLDDAASITGYFVAGRSACQPLRGGRHAAPGLHAAGGVVDDPGNVDGRYDAQRVMTDVVVDWLAASRWLRQLEPVS
jgi:hypothetical protein